MLFHYGNCKNEIHSLKRREEDYLKQIQELKALYDYQVGVLEKDIAELQKRNDNQAMSITLFKVDHQDHTQLIAMRDQEIEELKTHSRVKMDDILKLMGENEQLKVERRELMNELGARKCVIDSCEQEIKDLKREYRAVQNNEPVAIAERVPHTGEIIHYVYTDGEVATFRDLTKPNSETFVDMGKPMKDAAYYKLLKDNEEKYGIPEKKPHRKQKKK